MVKKTEEFLATGRRKCAVARVRVKFGTGSISINGRDWTEYFPSDALRGYIVQPLKVSAQEGKLDIVATIDGGGASGQAGALRHGVSRALCKINEELRPALKENGMLTRDSRVKERKKSGQPGARKRFQFSKR